MSSTENSINIPDSDQENESDESSFKSANASAIYDSSSSVENSDSDESKKSSDHAESTIELPETDDEEEIKVRPKKKVNRIEDSDAESDEEETKRKSLYKAESSDDDEIEDQVAQKATRRSIFGFNLRKSVAPAISSDDSDSSVDIVTDESDDEDEVKVKAEQSESSMMSSTIRSPFKDISNETFDKSIKAMMSSTVSPKEESQLLDEATGGEEEKFKVSPGQYAEIVAAIDGLEIQKSSLKKLIASQQLPDGGAKLKIRLDKLQHEIDEKTAVRDLMEVDENLSLKNEIKRSFQSEQASIHAISINDSVELHKALDLKDVVPVGNIGAKKFQQQKALTVDKLEEICGNLASRPPEDSLAEAPKHLKVVLMDHQLHGIQFMMWREQCNPRGGILADDMGLGKTLTTIGLVLKGIQRYEDDEEDSDSEEEDDDEGWKGRGRKDLRSSRATLIVCPASLIKQWESEIQTKVKRAAIECHLFHGPNREYKARRLAKYDVVLTSYQIVVSEERNNGTLFQVKWKRIVLDEGHVIRNHKSKQSEAICKLSSKYRWVLTGTPIHNKEFDIYAAFKFLRCDPFSDLIYWKRYIEVNKGKESSPRVQAMLKAILLRRTKEELISTGAMDSLPTKTIHQVDVKMNSQERQIYMKFMAYSQTIFATFLMQHESRNDNFTYDRNRLGRLHKQLCANLKVNREIKSHEILLLLLRLRQMCCHPGLTKKCIDEFDNGTVEGAQHEEADPDESVGLMQEFEKLKIHVGEGESDDEDAEDVDVYEMSTPSSKILKMMETLREHVLPSDDKVIIVSQWTGYLEVIRNLLQDEGVVCCELNGQIPVKFRNDIVMDFNKPTSNKKVMLLSLTAGGVGLNLTGANYMFLMDLHWNPQLEQQVYDRIYRYGQKKDVNIFKFVCEESIENHILNIQAKKLASADNALTGKKTDSKLTIEDLKMLFGWAEQPTK